MNQKKLLLSSIIFIIMVICLGKPMKARAASAVSIVNINYETMELVVDANENPIIYYSTDKTSWSELEALVDSLGNYRMDISWIPATSDKMLYFKGDVVKSIISVKIPKQNTGFKVSYNKADGSFNFSGYESAEYFQWRNTSDYSWNTVSFDEATSSYQAFLAAMERNRVKTSKIIIRTMSIEGKNDSEPGERSSKEVNVSIPARANAPSVKVNIKKLTINTSAAMEYFDTKNNQWVECDKNMNVQELAPGALYANGAHTVFIKIRNAETATRAYSKTATLMIPGQEAAPTLGDTSKDVSYYYSGKNLVLQFTKASSSNVYEYVVVKLGVDFDINTTNWTSVRKTSLVKLSESRIPSGSVIYMRKAGVNATPSKNIEMELPSAYVSLKVQ